MKSYSLENLDCANCAAKIEEGLNALPFVDNAVIQFSTLKLHIDTKHIEKVASEIKRIEPDVNLVIETTPQNTVKQNKNGLPIFLIASLILYFAALYFEEAIAAPLNGIAYYAIFGILYIVNGWKVLRKAVLNILKGDIFDENFLMSIATIGAVIIHALPEAAGVMLFYQMGLYFERLATERSRKSIEDLLDTKNDIAHIVKEDATIDTNPADVAIGSLILVKPGERIPLDGTLEKGEAFLDTSALTGESRPRKVRKDDAVLSGMIVKDSSIHVRTNKNYSESTLTKITKLVEEAANKKAPTEKFITAFAKIYTPIVVVLALITALVPSLLLGCGSLAEWTYKGLVLLVISCPCALVISIPLAYFGGIGAASKKGFLIKGSNYIDSLAKLKTIAFDKTGTITKGVFTVQEVEIFDQTYTKEDVLSTAAAIESHSTHPIAAAIVNFAENNNISKNSSEMEICEIPGKGLSVSSNENNWLLGNAALLKDNEVNIGSTANGTVIYFADQNTKKLIAAIVLGDEIKSDTPSALNSLKNLGIQKQIMLTGDSETAAAEIANKLDIEYKAQLLPQDKARLFEELKDGPTAFVGDGINDAPVLAMADVGISMGSMGSDSAIESSDLVIMNDSLSKIPEAISLSKATKAIVSQNIVFALGIKILIMGFGIAGLSGMWEAVFADVGVTILAVLNTLRLLRK